MPLGDLTTLKHVKAWLASQSYVATSSSDNDDMIKRLISQYSGIILAELERPWILPRVYTNDQYDGNGGPVQFLRNWPVLSIQQLSVSGQVISESIPDPTKPPGLGWRIETWDGVPPGSPQSIKLTGTRFCMGKLNVLVNYTAGYQVAGEAATIPAPTGSNVTSILSPLQPYGIWAQNVKVTYDDGTPLSPVTVDPTIAGTYRVLPADDGTPLSDPGVYKFFTGISGDSGKDILFTYGFIPAALEEAAIELVCERIAYRQHIGEISRTVGQQVTARYRDDEFPPYVKSVFQRFRSILPL